MRQEWSSDELIAAWTLVDEDWPLVGNKTGATRLGFAVLLKFFEIEARFPQHVGEVPQPAVAYLAEQVNVPAAEFAKYSWSGRSIEYHLAQLLDARRFPELVAIVAAGLFDGPPAATLDDPDYDFHFWPAPHPRRRGQPHRTAMNEPRHVHTPGIPMSTRRIAARGLGWDRLAEPGTDGYGRFYDLPDPQGSHRALARPGEGGRAHMTASSDR